MSLVDQVLAVLEPFSPSDSGLKGKSVWSSLGNSLKLSFPVICVRFKLALSFFLYLFEIIPVTVSRFFADIDDLVRSRAARSLPLLLGSSCFGDISWAYCVQDDGLNRDRGPWGRQQLQIDYSEPQSRLEILSMFYIQNLIKLDNKDEISLTKPPAATTHHLSERLRPIARNLFPVLILAILGYIKIDK